MVRMLLERLALVLLGALLALALIEQFNPARDPLLVDAAPHTGQAQNLGPAAPTRRATVGGDRPADQKRRADYPLCVTAKPPPLLRSPNGKYDMRMGRKFNDGGTA